MIDRRLFLKGFGLTIATIQAPYLFADTGEIKFDDQSNNLSISDIKSYLKKMSSPDIVNPSDIFVLKTEREVFDSSFKKLYALLNRVGYVKFSALDISQARTLVSFTDDEMDYLKKLFMFDASNFGFYRDKPLSDFNAKIDSTKLTQANGILCFDGKTIDKYRAMKDSIGDDVFMSSGIRSIVKQSFLFIQKARHCDYNLSMASRTIAPPGYSYHGVGYFDIGSRKISLSQNFTDQFADTGVFKKAAKDGYISLRYGLENKLGVRYGPWHVKV